MACKSLSHQAVKGIELTSSIKEDTYTGTCKCSAFLQWSACLCSQTDKIRVWSRTNIYIFFVFLQNIAVPTMAPFSGKKRNHLESHIKKYIGFSFSFGNWLHTVASVTVLIWNCYLNDLRLSYTTNIFFNAAMQQKEKRGAQTDKQQTHRIQKQGWESKAGCFGVISFVEIVFFACLMIALFDDVSRKEKKVFCFATFST